MRQPRKYYIAFGANTNPNGMRHRCPNANLVGTSSISGWKLVFRGTADIAPFTDADVNAERRSVPVIVWSITESCEQALDIYEGYPTVYNKRNFNVMHPNDGAHISAMAYVMEVSSDYTMPPGAYYYKKIHEGYKAFRLPTEHLEAAYRDALPTGTNTNAD